MDRPTWSCGHPVSPDVTTEEARLHVGHAVEQARKQRRAVLVCGPPGAGKTKLAHSLGLDVYDIATTSDGATTRRCSVSTSHYWLETTRRKPWSLGQAPPSPLEPRHQR